MKPEVAFGVVLRELRKRKGLSQEKLAHETEMERNYISLLELGKNSVSLKKIFKLAGALGIGVADLMGMVEAKTLDMAANTREPIDRLRHGCN